MALKKPASIKASSFKSAKWDEITAGRNFQKSDIPTITLLCQWYAVIERCIYDIDEDGDPRVAYMNDIGDIKSMPQISVMKQASAEIRALNKQLGINDEVIDKPKQNKVVTLHVMQQARQSKAASRRGTAAS